MTRKMRRPKTVRKKNKKPAMPNGGVSMLEKVDN